LPEISVEHPFGTSLINGASQVNFGNVVIGSPPIYKTVTIRNSGTGSLTGVGVSLVNPNGLPFTIYSPSWNSIAPGISKSFTVGFKPEEAGYFNASVQIVSNDVGRSPFVFDISGSGITAPEIAIEQPPGTPLKDNFGEMVFKPGFVERTGETKAIVIRNAGTATLSMLGISISGPNDADFLIGPLEVSDLEPGASLQFSATFMPSGAGIRSATLRITSNDSDEEIFEILMVGASSIPQPEIVVEQPKGNGLYAGWSKKTFGKVKVGKTGVAKTFTIKNTGTANLSGLAITKKGKNAKDFIVSSPLNTSLTQGGSTTFRVTFKPKAAGTRNAAIQIRNNDPDENPFNINLSGFGVTK
jgi:hypothetical protein